jgi:hypothetical protein
VHGLTIMSNLFALESIGGGRYIRANNAQLTVSQSIFSHIITSIPLLNYPSTNSQNRELVNYCQC